MQVVDVNSKAKRIKSTQNCQVTSEAMCPKELATDVSKKSSVVLFRRSCEQREEIGCQPHDCCVIVGPWLLRLWCIVEVLTDRRHGDFRKNLVEMLRPTLRLSWYVPECLQLASYNQLQLYEWKPRSDSYLDIARECVSTRDCTPYMLELSNEDSSLAIP